MLALSALCCCASRSHISRPPFDRVAVRRVVRLPHHICSRKRERLIERNFAKLTQVDQLWSVARNSCDCISLPTLSYMRRYLETFPHRITEEIDLEHPGYFHDNEPLAWDTSGVKLKHRYPFMYTHILFIVYPVLRRDAVGTYIWFGHPENPKWPQELVYTRRWFPGDPFYLTTAPC